MAPVDKSVCAEMAQIRQQERRSRELQARRRRLRDELAAGMERLADAQLTARGLSVGLRLAAIGQRESASAARLLRPPKGRAPRA